MILLVIGAKGQLGNELVRQGCRPPLNVVPVDIDEIDITRPDEVERALDRIRPHLVVNAAAYTDVERAETEPQTAVAVNRDAPGLLATAAARRTIPLVHVSTDFVFDGAKGSPYLEDDPIGPLSVYGQSKADGEAAVRSRLAEHIILRTSWLYSERGSNFVRTMLHLGSQRQTLKVVDDQFGCPTSAEDLAEAILQIIDRFVHAETLPWGTYHYCGNGVTTWHGFAEAIFASARRHAPLPIRQVEAISASQYPAKARRPAYSALDCGRIGREFGIRPRPWQKSLDKTVDRIMSAGMTKNTLEP